MTSPVTTAAAPAARAAAGADAPGGSGGEPFASALDGAIAAGRSEVDGSGPDGEQSGPAQDDAAEAAAPDGPAVADGAVPGGGVVAALWARLTGALGGTGATPGEGEGAATGAPAVTGRAHALEVASGKAHGLRGTAPGQLAAGVPVPAGTLPDGTAQGAPVPGPPAAPRSPAGAGPVLPPPPPAAADAVAALAAAGVELVVAPSAGTAGPAAAPVALAPLVAPTAAQVSAPDATAVSAPVADAGPAVAVPPVAGAPSGGTDTGPWRGPAEDGASETAPVAPSGGTPAPSATVAPARAGASGPAVAPPVAGQLARSVAVLRGGPDGVHTMTVVLTPEALGPVEVSVTLDQGSVELILRGAHEHGRAALLDAVPDLRRDLEAAGLTCSRVDVDRGGRDGFSSAQQQSAGRDPGGRQPQHDRGETGARPWHRPADNGEGRPAPSRSASGLDVRV